MNFWFHCCLFLLLGFKLIQALPSADIPSEGQTIEDDILVTPNLVEYMKGTTSQKREIHQDVLLWQKTGAYVRIPYKIDGLDSGVKAKLLQAMKTFKKLTCVEFFPHNGEKNYILFAGNSNAQCNSEIGRQTKGRETKVSLSSNCNSLSTVLHEIMHALGFLHEQSREDRDDYVKVNFENIDQRDINQFAKYSLQSFGFRYDWHSLMHYKKNAFSRNGKSTIEAKADPSKFLGNNKFFSEMDVIQLNTVYTCPSRYLQVSNFLIKIYTSNKWWAATGATVYLELEGTNVEDSSGEMKVGNEFDENSKVEFEQMVPKFSVTKLSVRHDNSGYGPAWHLDKIIVEDKASGTSVTFKCSCWIEGTRAKILTA